MPKKLTWAMELEMKIYLLWLDDLEFKHRAPFLLKDGGLQKKEISFNLGCSTWTANQIRYVFDTLSLWLAVMNDEEGEVYSTSGEMTTW